MYFDINLEKILKNTNKIFGIRKIGCSMSWIRSEILKKNSLLFWFLEARAEILKNSLLFWSKWWQQKEISKLTDLKNYIWAPSISFEIMYVCRTCKWHRICNFVCKLCIAWSTRIFQSLSFLQNTSVDSICLQLSNKFVNPPCAVISVIIVTNKI